MGNNVLDSICFVLYYLCMMGSVEIKTPNDIGDVRAFKCSFHERLAALPSAFSILEYMTDIMFFMKDREGRITSASNSFAIQMGGQCEDDILGRDAFNLCPQKLAAQYTVDDRRVMEA